MNPITIEEIAESLNLRADSYAIGQLQDIRKKLRRQKRKLTRYIFGRASTFPEYAFHLGGRTELQFNIGLEDYPVGDKNFRYGVAFSLELSPTLLSIETLKPSIRRFNEFLRHNSHVYGDMRMWDHTKAERSADRLPEVIDDGLVQAGTFVFLGKHCPLVDVRYEVVLEDFDRLLPLYEYVGGGQALDYVAARRPILGIDISGGRLSDLTKTISTRTAREIEVELRHNGIQGALLSWLMQQGLVDVHVEVPQGQGTRIDAVARSGGHLRFYEIKTGLSARACIRAAVGQLLEYALWPGMKHQASELVVVGEAGLDRDADAYLQRLNRNFPLPISYQKIVVDP